MTEPIHSASADSGNAPSVHTPEFDFSSKNDAPVKTQPVEVASAPEPPAASASSVPVPPKAPEKERRMLLTEGNNLTFGRYLRELRIRNNLEFKDLEAETKIRSDYLCWIEQEDFQLLPPPVYVLAYVRKLCGFYGVDTTRAESMAEEVRSHLELTAPSELSKVVIDQEISDENDRLLKKFMLFATIGVLVIVVLTGGLVSVFKARQTTSTTDDSSGQSLRFDARKLQDLSEGQRVEAGKLPVRDWQNR